MTTVTVDRAVLEQALEALEQCGLGDTHRSYEFEHAARAALRAALAQQAEPDLSRCPQCNGPADNGFDRSFPPSPYLCTKCMAEPVQDSGYWGRVAAQQAEPDHETRAELAEQQVVQLAEERDHYRGLWQKAQQAAPAQEPYTGDVTRIMRDAGMTFHLGLPHKAVVEQMTRVVDLVYAEASIKAAQQFAVALAQQAEGGGNLPPPLQAEPVEPVDVGLLEYRGNSVAFIHQKMTAYRAGIDAAWDAFRANGLHPDGKTSLADMIAKYIAPPQRTMVPLTEKEMYAVEEEARKNFRLSQKGPRGQQITYWDGLTPWLIRAVERAHGIKE